MPAALGVTKLLVEIEERLFDETPSPRSLTTVAEPATKLLVRLAKRLNALPVTAFGSVPAEFVVYACDRNEPATKLVTASLTARKRAALQRLRLI